MKQKGRVFLRFVLMLSIIVGANIFLRTHVEAAAQPPAAIDQIFPDEALAKEIQLELGKASVTDTVTQAELNSIATLDVSAKGISSLEGMNYLTNLSSFTFSQNQVSDLSPLKGLMNLTLLALYDNQVTSLAPLTDLVNLRVMQLSGNPISDLAPLANLGNLIALDINDANISDIKPLIGLTKLTILGISNNQLSDISALKDLHQMISLNVSQNKLTNLNGIQELTKLSTLYAKENQIKDIQSLTALTSLNTLELSSNQIANIQPLQGLINLQTLYLLNNQISDVNGLASLVNLDWLNINQNQISNIRPLNSLKKLTIIQMSDQLIINEPIAFQNTITIPNIVKNIAEQTIDPDVISDNGVYADGDISWTLSNFTPSVSYSFNERDTVGNATGIFSGTVQQPLIQYYKVIFNVDGEEKTEDVETGTFIDEPAAPTKEGYTFTGWYDEQTGGTKWDFTANPMPANDITLYAQFSINSYKANFDVDGVISTQVTEYRNLLEEPKAPTKEGYTFLGWYDAKSGGTKWDFTTNTMPANDITLYAQFSKNASTGGDSGKTENSSNEKMIVSEKPTILPTTGDKGTFIPMIIGALLTGVAIFGVRRE
ncbi:LPXTG cell wall anchor domain-containing protein [Listeria monocytogenes]|nr:LPXTG cell wall anchor domain-containing protein [Listeria monocytogenes]EAF5967710.1 LPXTG cell wall anchor domain-containing protein [Listeria monocytogenes]